MNLSHHRISQSSMSTQASDAGAAAFTAAHPPTRARLRLLQGLSLLRHLLLLLGTFWYRLAGVTLRIFHFSIAVGPAALMVGVKFLANLRLRIGLEVLVDTFVIFVGATAVRWSSIVTGREVLVLESSCQNGSGLYRYVSTSQAKGTLILTSSAISFLVLMPFARKKFSSGCCSSLRGVSSAFRVVGVNSPIDV